MQVLPVVCQCLLRDRARRRHWQWHVYGCFAGFYLAMSSLPWCAGPDARRHGWYEPEGLFRALIPAVACARLVLLVILHLALCFFPCRQAQDARHHGRYGSPGGAALVVCNNRCLGLEVQKTAGSPQLHFINKVVRIPVEVQRSFPTVQTVLRTLQILQLQFVARWSVAGTTGAFLGQRYGRAHCAGRDCAQNCGGLRSCSSSASWPVVYEAYESIFHIFHVTVFLDPEVDSLPAVEIWISTSPLYLAVTACTYVSYFRCFST